MAAAITTPPSASRRSSRRSGDLIAVVDSGVLYAATDVDDANHGAAAAVLRRGDLRLVVPAFVVAEVTYFVGRRLGAAAEASLLRGLGEVDVETPLPEEWARIAELVERYGDFPLGGTDASVIALAERLDTALVLTLDRRHFAAVRPRHRDGFEILP